jgi:hypothetical protein
VATPRGSGGRARWALSPSSCWLTLLVALALAGFPADGRAQRRPFVAARVHPELVDTTWGPRMQTAWRLAWAGRWSDADEAFSTLRREQPDAMEPYVGLAFVARGQLRFDAARRYYRDALVREPGADDVRRQAEELEWVRPGAVEALIGRSASATTSSDLLSVDVVAPVRRGITLLGRGGAFAAGDPLRASPSGRADSAGATLVGVGVVLQLTTDLWLTPRIERWSARGTTNVYGWLDGAYRVAGRLSLLASIRALNGAGGAPMFAGGGEMAITRSGDVFTIYGVHALRPTVWESRNQFRAFFTGAATRRILYRVGGVAERGGTVSAVTLAAGATYLPEPRLGLRVELARRTGFASQQSALVGLVTRW